MSVVKYASATAVVIIVLLLVYNIDVVGGLRGGWAVYNCTAGCSVKDLPPFMPQYVTYGCVVKLSNGVEATFLKPGYTYMSTQFLDSGMIFDGRLLTLYVAYLITWANETYVARFSFEDNEPRVHVMPLDTVNRFDIVYQYPSGVYYIFPVKHPAPLFYPVEKAPPPPSHDVVLLADWTVFFFTDYRYRVVVDSVRNCVLYYDPRVFYMAGKEWAVGVKTPPQQ